MVTDDTDRGDAGRGFKRGLGYGGGFSVAVWTALCIAIAWLVGLL